MRAYFDHAATSPMNPEVLAAYSSELQRVGNPSSLHAEGQAARMRMETAREDLARTIGAATPSEVVFTSGGTEADNLAVKGLWWARNADRSRPRLLVSTIEHSAVTDTAEWLQTQGAEVVWVPVDADGRLDLAAFGAALREDPERTALASVMSANNEIGTLQPIPEIVALAHSVGVPVHTDAVQALGQVPLDFAALGVDAMSLSAHKIGGPVGTGALVISRDLTPVPVLHGGGQERKIRSGTLDVAGAVAFARAAELACADLPEKAAVRAALRDRLIAGIESSVPDAVLSGPRGAGRLPGNVHFVFPGCEGDALLFGLDVAGFATSVGSACSAGVARPSHVLIACGRDEDTARSVQRFSLGPTTTAADVDALLAALPGIVDRARSAGMVSSTPAWMNGDT
ncbi:cysteine desulfurase family protein [Brevibacterium daeguense]|uniref:cysteine desulfurase n=1 Tax=Brevibacterium daeguense TaxID=909936 RepID=A0ABP8ELN5_9MICO